MNCSHEKNYDIKIPEATTRYIIVTVINDDGTPDDLTNYEASFCMKRGDTKEIVKKCTVNKNEISTLIEPEDTVGASSAKYEIRIYKNSEVYRVIQGRITISCSVHPFTTMPET